MENKKPDNGMQITAVNITYGNIVNKRIKNRPNMSVLDLPANIIALKDTDKFNDQLETFVYNTLTKKYGAEVSHCQIYLP